MAAIHMHALQKILAGRLESKFVLLNFYFPYINFKKGFIFSQTSKRNFKFVDIVFLYSCWNPPVFRLVFGDAEKNVLSNKE